MNYSIDKILLPSGEERYELRIWESGRRAKQIKRRFKTRKDAVAHSDKLAREERKANSIDPMSVKLFGEEYQNWRATEAKNFAPGWLKNLDGYWEELRDKLEYVKIANIDESLASRMVSGLHGKGNSKKTIRNKIGLVLAVLNYSVKVKRIQRNPIAKFPMPQVGKSDIEFWEKEFALSFLNFLNDRYPRGSEMRRVYLSCLVALNTGVRAGELWALRPRSLRKSQNVIRVSDQLNRVTHKFAPLKGKEARNVPLNADVLGELEYWVLSEGLGLGDLLFTHDGKPVVHDCFAATFDREVATWGGPRITFHGLRHTAATLMLASGVDIKTLQEIMGHKDVQTTMKYVHLLGANVAKAAQTFSLKAERKAHLQVVG